MHTPRYCVPHELVYAFVDLCGPVLAGWLALFASHVSLVWSLLADQAAE